jgi:hypothetical protein
MSVHNPYDGKPPKRLLSRCKHCERQSAVFFARFSVVQSWYHCTRRMCGRLFVAAHPVPLKRTWNAEDWRKP